MSLAIVVMLGIAGTRVARIDAITASLLVVAAVLMWLP